MWIERLAQQDSQLGRPVHQRQAQPLQVGVPGSELSFDGRNLLAALRDSCRILPAFRRNLLERSPVAI